MGNSSFNKKHGYGTLIVEYIVLFILPWLLRKGLMLEDDKNNDHIWHISYGEGTLVVLLLVRIIL